MRTLLYTPKIITLLSAQKKLEAVKEAKELYGLSLVQAKDMIDRYVPGGNNYYTIFEPADSTNTAYEKYNVEQPQRTNNQRTLTQPSTQPTSAEQNNIIPFCCPNCGSEQVKKSLGGKMEHIATVGTVKVAKKFILGDYSGFTGGVENDIIKQSVPFQQVCEYCHYTFHASKSQIEAGAFSMNKDKAKSLFNAYNIKLQGVKDKEVQEKKEKASNSMLRAMIAGVIFFIGLLISMNCTKTEENFLGMESFTWTYMFSWLLIFAGILGAIIEGIFASDGYSQASYIEKMSLTKYAKNHKA